MSYTETIWNTELINETLEKLRYGAPVDMSGFYQRDPQLKAANILFQLTREEEQEFIKCSGDINYFVESYCKFMTDKGRDLVDLRDYQEDILSTLGKEKWIEELDDFGPEVRNYILMASRQVGKCLSYDSRITITNKQNNIIKEIYIGELFDIIKNQQAKLTRKQRLISKIKLVLYKFFNYLDKRC